jgi:hypothetical protein
MKTLTKINPKKKYRIRKTKQAQQKCKETLVCDTFLNAVLIPKCPDYPGYYLFTHEGCNYIQVIPISAVRELK